MRCRTPRRTAPQGGLWARLSGVGNVRGGGEGAGKGDEARRAAEAARVQSGEGPVWRGCTAGGAARLRSAPRGTARGHRHPPTRPAPLHPPRSAGCSRARAQTHAHTTARDRARADKHNATRTHAHTYKHTHTHTQNTRTHATRARAGAFTSGKGRGRGAGAGWLAGSLTVSGWGRWCGAGFESWRWRTWKACLTACTAWRCSATPPRTRLALARARSRARGHTHKHARTASSIRH